MDNLQKYVSDATTFETNVLHGPERSVKDLSHIDIFPHNLAGRSTSDRPSLQEEVRHVLSPETVPSFYNSVTIRMSVFFASGYPGSAK